MHFMDGYTRDQGHTEELIALVSSGLRDKPDQRFGQLLCNAMGWHIDTLFNVYDEKIIEGLRSYLHVLWVDGTATTSTDRSLQRAVELLDQFDRGTRLEEHDEYPGSPFETIVTEFLQDHGKRPAARDN